MPRIRGILETALYCDDVQRTAGFYRQLLDLRPMLETERLIAFDAGQGSVLLLFQRGQSSQPVTTSGGLVPPHDGSGPSHFAFAIDATDIGAWEAKLQAINVAVESHVVWERGGRSLYFRDPDGRSVELATPGLWPSY